MPHIKEIKKISSDLRLSDKFPITHLNSPTVFEAANGMIGTTIRLAGVPFDTEKNETINDFRRLWKQALKGLNESIYLHVTIHRELINPSLGGNFPNSFSINLNERYEEKFCQSRLYKNTIYLTLVYKGITSGKSGFLIKKLSRLSEKTVKNARSMIREEQMNALDKVVNQMLSLLSVFKPQVLGTRDVDLGHSELLEFLGLIVNGGKSLPFPMPLVTLPISEPIANFKQVINKYPNGKIGQYLCGNRLFFGKAIQFQGTDDTNKFAAMLSIKQYPSQTNSLIFDNLLHLDAEFIATHTFAIEARDVALNLIEKQEKYLKNVEDKGISQIAQLAILQDAIASGNDLLGYHHHSLMVFADSIKTLDKKVNDTVRIYAESGVLAIREDIGQEAAFFSQIPTNLKYIARSVMISADNFTDFCPFHNYQLGYRDSNHLGGAVTLFETAAKTPYFFNFHPPSPNKSLLSGHTIIIGAAGAGKTALMTFLDAQASRYNGFTFVFDIKRGFEFYIRACGGYYTILSPNEKSVTFNPFQLPDIPSNREFCKRWLVQLVKENEMDEIDQLTKELLANCVDYAYDALAPEHRFLSNAIKLLPITFSRWPNLRRWLKAHDKYHDGSHAYLFDNAEDGFKFHRKMAFDMTYFVEKEPAHIRTAVVMYLLHRLEMVMNENKELLSIYMDEAWKFLSDPYWTATMSTFLAQIRSKNGHFIFATQTPETVLNSSIHPVIAANTETKILFCNSKAIEKTYKEGFDLSQQEFEAIKDTNESKRFFLVKQRSESVLCRLNLAGLGDELMILSPSEAELSMAEKIREKVGDDPSVWIPLVTEERNRLAGDKKPAKREG